MKVRATMAGTYGRHHIMPGEVFDVDPKFFCDATISRYGWMVKVEEEPPKVKPVGQVQIIETAHEKEVREWLENEKKAKEAQS